MNVTFHHRDILAPGVQTLWFTPEQPVDYVAGQFTELYLPHDADERGERRWFTLSSSPTEPLLGITTRFSKDNGSSFKRRLAALQLGTQLRLADPMGDFVLPKDPSVPLIFVATGLGITPMRSMVQYLHDKQEKRAIRLMYGVRESGDALYKDLFEAYGLTPEIHTKNVPNGSMQQAAPITAEHLLPLLASDESALLYTAGPELFVETLIKDLRTAGVREHRLVGDYFPGYPLT